MCEAARDLAPRPGGIKDRALRRRLPFVMEVLEPIPGDGGLERVVDDSCRCQKLAGIGHANERIAPHARSTFEMRITGSWLRHTTMGGAAFDRSLPPDARPPTT